MDYMTSITVCEFLLLAIRYRMFGMKTIAEIRRERVEELILRFATIANLNVALGWPRTDPKLAQIRNANTRPGRDKPYQMGDAMAREIEEVLGLERGWMDNASNPYALPSDSRTATLLRIMEAMPEWQKDQAVKIVAALAEPTQPPSAANGQ